MPSPFAGNIRVRDWKMAKGVSEIRSCDMTKRDGDHIGMRVDLPDGT
jgi:hypothetical protein